MVAISSQYSFGADKAVQIASLYFFDKQSQPELRHKNCKITLLIWVSDLNHEWIFWIQTFGKFQYCSIFYAHATDCFCLEVLTFKMAIKVSAWKPEVNENATLSTVNIAINDNHRLWPYNLRMSSFKWFSLIEALVISQILGKFHSVQDSIWIVSINRIISCTKI